MALKAMSFTDLSARRFNAIFQQVSIHHPTVSAFDRGTFLTRLQCLNFLVDKYGLYAASAVSANTFLRSLLACSLPLAASPMFNGLGVGPAGSSVAVLAWPVPFILMKYGLRLRGMSKFAPTAC